MGQHILVGINTIASLVKFAKVGGTVSIKVYDLLGREVATLVNEKQVAGSYKVTFDASKLASGFYVVRMSAGNYVKSQKMQ